MKRYLSGIVVTICMVLVYGASCRHDPQKALSSEDGNYPADVAKIIMNKCAISGCHNAASYQNANGLQLDTWDHLFYGGNSGAAVIAYSPRFSPLLYFVNTDASIGPVATPRMPLNTTSMPMSALSKSEYAVLEAWIARGAPDKNGNIPFSSNSDTRQKIYLTNQGCDLLAVIDPTRNVVMRYIPIGTSTATESPHCVRVSSDGSYAYVSFLNGDYVQKIDTKTDTVVGSAYTGPGTWNIVYVLPGDSNIVTTDWQSNGQVVFSNTGSMTTLPSLTGNGSGVFIYPHGITSTAGGDTVLVTGQYGNIIYKYAPRGVPYYKKISVDGNSPEATTAGDNTSPNPHDILMAPDYARYFVTCQGTNEVRVMDARADTLFKVIPVGIFPQEMAISNTLPYLFVTCMEDAATTFAGGKGSVYVINYQTLQVVKVIYGDFYQPHGITVDDRDGYIYVASTNANPDGPAPHHATACSGRAGWYSVYDINTLKPLNGKRYEVTVLPYSAAVRFR